MLSTKLLTLTFDELLQHGLQGDLSFLRAGCTVFELDPAFIEAIQHTNSWCGILHALRSEKRLPGPARHSFRPHITAKQFSECSCDLVRGHAAWPFQLDDPAARPRFLKQVRSH